LNILLVHLVSSLFVDLICFLDRRCMSRHPLCRQGRLLTSPRCRQVSGV
jgi:hypothetical protein